MRSNVVQLADDHQFSFQCLKDGALLQLYYRYDSPGRRLLEANLAYYGTRLIEEAVVAPPTEGEGERLDEDIAFDLIGMDDGLIGWLRIDYKPEDTRGVLHHCCHMHIGGMPDSRVVVDRLPSPIQFIEFVMASFYPEDYFAHRLNDTGQYRDINRMQKLNQSAFQHLGTEICERIGHFRIPGQ